tara:strand:- start:9761 stop:10252 length:492 start_codon:yes stop_codon:yes gene_type:complete
MAANKKQNSSNIPTIKEMEKIINYLVNKMDNNDLIPTLPSRKNGNRNTTTVSRMFKKLECSMNIEKIDKDNIQEIAQHVHSNLNADVNVQKTTKSLLKNISMFADRNDKLVSGYYRQGHPSYEMPNDIMQVGNQYAPHAPIPNNDNGNDEEDAICKVTSCAIL